MRRTYNELRLNAGLTGPALCGAVKVAMLADMKKLFTIGYEGATIAAAEHLFGSLEGRA